MNFDESRLDRYIKKIYGKHIPQSFIEKALRNKDIVLNGLKAKSSDKVQPEDNVVVKREVERIFANIFCSTREQPNQKIYCAEDIEKFRKMIIFENDDLLIINKPAGIAVQLGSKINFAIDVIAKQYYSEARLCHRLDKETSGIVILAKNIKTSRYMLHLFQKKQIQKKYLAIISGEVALNEREIITISKPLLKNKNKVVIDFEQGKNAITEIRIIKKLSKNKFLISAIPQTGRTHQIRVHLASINLPIVGDDKYYGAKAKHMYLHAAEISFVSIEGKKILIKAPPPEYFI